MALSDLFKVNLEKTKQEKVETNTVVANPNPPNVPTAPLNPQTTTQPVQGPVNNNTNNKVSVTKKLPMTFIVLPGIIVFLIIFIVAMSYKQSNTAPSPTPAETPELYATPQPSNVTGVISKAGYFKIVKSGTVEDYFVTSFSGEAIRIIFSEKFQEDRNKYSNKKVLASGVYDVKSKILTVDNMSEYDPEGIVAEPTAPPVVFPNNSPTPTPSLPQLSSPVN